MTCLLAINRLTSPHRSTKPKTLLKLAASLVLQPSIACADRRMEAETLKNGISYFTGPLLNWTLVGVIKALLRDIFERKCVLPAQACAQMLIMHKFQCAYPP